jgi:hypothetical protein
MRSVRLKALTVMLAAALLPQTAAWSARFVDTAGGWSEKYIIRLSDKGIIPAASDGKFNPNQPITRAQLADWLVKVLGLDNQPVPTTSSFADVKTDDWFFRPVEIIRQSNYISGYADGFRPNQFIQRAEVMVILSRTLEAPEPDLKTIAAELSKYTDSNKVPGWAKTGVAEASLAGILVNDQNPQLLNPTSIATRGETAALLSKLDEYKGQKQVEVGERQPMMDPQGMPPGGGNGLANNGGATQAPNNPSNYSGGPGTAFSGGVNRELYNPPQNGYQTPPPQFSDQQQQAQQGQVQQGQQQAPPAQFQTNPGQAQQGQYAPSQQAQQPPTNVLQGGVTTVAAGTDFQARLGSTLNSGTTQPGEQVQATLGQPLYSNGVEAIPAGSTLSGTVTKVMSAKRFHAGRNGSLAIKFTTVDTPDGRRFPIAASVDGSKIRLSGGTTAGRVGKGLMATGIGAGSGAIVGTAIGAIVGASSNAGMGRSLAMGAIFGTAIGGGAGAVTAVVRKGSEVKFPTGMQLPIKLDSPFQITAPTPQPYYGGGYGSPQGGYGGPPGYMPQQR